MSDETTSQTNTEDVIDQPKIGEVVEEKESKGPAPIYEETAEDKALKASEQTQEESQKPVEEDQNSDEDKEEQEEEQDKDKSGEEKKASEDTDYESLDVPEDTMLQEEDIQRILKQSKEEGLTKESAQKRLEDADILVKNYATRATQTLEQAAEQWAKDTRADKEIGGEKYKESVELARRTAHKFGTPAFLESLNKTGFGNHPEVIRVFARIGRQMQDDKLVTDGTQTVHKGVDLASKFYGSENQNN